MVTLKNFFLVLFEPILDSALTPDVRKVDYLSHELDQ